MTEIRVNAIKGLHTADFLTATDAEYSREPNVTHLSRGVVTFHGVKKFDFNRFLQILFKSTFLSNESRCASSRGRTRVHIRSCST